MYSVASSPIKQSCACNNTSHSSLLYRVNGSAESKRFGDFPPSSPEGRLASSDWGLQDGRASAGKSKT